MTDEKRPASVSHDANPVEDGWKIINQLLAGLVLYGTGGWLLDRWLGTKCWVGVGIVAGAVLGIVSVYVQYRNVFADESGLRKDNE